MSVVDVGGNDIATTFLSHFAWLHLGVKRDIAAEGDLTPSDWLAYNVRIQLQPQRYLNVVAK